MRRIVISLLATIGFKNVLGFATVGEGMGYIKTSGDKGDLVWLFCYPEDSFELDEISDLPGLNGTTWKLVVSVKKLLITEELYSKNIRKIIGQPFTKTNFEDELRRAVGKDLLNQWIGS